MTAWIALPIVTTISVVVFAFASSHDAFGWTINVLARISPLFLWGIVFTSGSHMLTRRLVG